MEEQKDITIQHPEVWELLLSIGNQRVDYILYTPTVAGSLMIGHVARIDDSLQSLEDAVYDTPELLNEYKRVRVIVHSQHFVLLPIETADEDCAVLVRSAFPADDGDVAVNALPLSGVKIAYLMPKGIKAFLDRTLNYPQLFHHLYPLCEHFKSLNDSDDMSRIFLNLNAESMDMAIYRKGTFLCANSYQFTNANDAAFFALNAWRSNGLDQLSDELQLMGDGTMRAAMTPMLREFVKYVMPAVYPAAAMQLGHNAMQAPLELILLALCE